MIFTTINDVWTWYQNSGIVNWIWFDGFNEEDLIRFVWQRADSDDDVTDQLIREFLVEHGEDPADYSL